MIRRPPRSTLDRSSAASDVYKRQLFERAADDAFAREVRERVSGANEAEVLEALRRFRKRHTVRIAWRDIAGWADLDETLRDLSALADACIGFAYTYMYEAPVSYTHLTLP